MSERLSEIRSFNTQPPEGGWRRLRRIGSRHRRFNTQPPEGGWESSYSSTNLAVKFQHAAARRRLGLAHIASRCEWQGFNTQPPEGGWQ